MPYAFTATCESDDHSTSAIADDTSVQEVARHTPHSITMGDPRLSVDMVRGEYA